MDLDLMVSSFPRLLNATLVTLKLLSLSLAVSYTHLTLPTIYSV